MNTNLLIFFIASVCLIGGSSEPMQAQTVVPKKPSSNPAPSVLDKHLRDIAGHTNRIMVTGVGSLYSKATSLNKGWDFYIQDKKAIGLLLRTLRCTDKITINAKTRHGFDVGNNWVQIRIWGNHSYDEINYQKHGKDTYLEDKQIYLATLQGSLKHGYDIQLEDCLRKLAKRAKVNNPAITFSHGGI
jgi:hypothetical protein